MKKLLGLVLTIFVVFMSYVFVGGFIQKQSKESQPTTSTNSSPLATSAKPSTSSASKTYTTSEIASHNNESDCWLLISSQVYDVTSFLGEHPGGAAMILPYCGKEATEAFATQDRGRSHSSQATDMLVEYKIGILKN